MGGPRPGPRPPRRFGGLWGGFRPAGGWGPRMGPVMPGGCGCGGCLAPVAVLVVLLGMAMLSFSSCGMMRPW